VGRHSMRRNILASMAAMAVTFATGAALADQPVPGGYGFQPAVTPIMKEITFFHNGILMPIITVITLFVLALLIYVIVRFNAKANPVPAKFSHNTLVEVVWTVIPVLILVVISAFSFPLLYRESTVPYADMTVKVTGHQWYWSYEYAGQDGVAFDSIMLEKADAEAAGKTYLLGVDTPMVVPVGKVVRMQVTAADVIHSWAMPALGVKMDAVPGRLNETWFKIEKPGIYFGQCSKICGVKHAYMPIEIHAVSQADYDLWLAKTKTADASPAVTTLASAE
jgi:cytochrome c oxidase subunit 2